MIEMVTTVANEKPAYPLPPEPCKFAIVQQVQIQTADDAARTFTFSTRAQNDQLLDFDATYDQVLSQRPAQAPDQVQLKPDKIGNLYLAYDGWLAAQAKGGIYGFNIPGVLLFKWPLCAPWRGIEPLDVVPSSIVVTGLDGEQYDLFSGDFAPKQQIVWNAASKLSLSDKNGKPVEVWPKKITVTAKPEGFPNLAPGTVDILDCTVSDFVQTLAWTTPRSPVTVRLNERGFEQFKIVQDAVHQYAAGAPVTYPGPLVDDLKNVGELAPHAAAALAKARDRAKTLTPDERAHGKRP
jgi:hypothetical protein